MKKKKKKRLPLICKNCKLWNKDEKVCSVVIIHDGEKMELETKAEDRCKWEEMGVDVHRLRAWSDGKNGYLEYTDKNIMGEGGLEWELPKEK